MLTWSHLGTFRDGQETVLLCDLREVARLIQRIDDGTWSALLDRHLGYERERRVLCTSYERGRAGVETWAARHEERLQREVLEFHRAHPAHIGDKGPPQPRPQAPSDTNANRE